MTPQSPRTSGSHRLGASALALAFALLASTIPFGLILAAEPATAPSTPDLAAGSDTGSSNSDNITQTLNGLVFTGTAEAGTTVRIYGGATEIGTSLTSAGGTWSITTTVALPDNTANVVTATAQHPAGAEGSASAPLTVTTDNTAPAAAPSVPDLAASSDTGTSNTDNITADTTPTFTGTSEAGATVQLRADGNVVGTGVATGTSWTVTANALAAGTYLFTATQLDAAGNGPSPASGSLSVEINTAVPAAPSAPDLVAASDTGPSNTDNITSDTTPTFTGTAAANSTVDLIVGAVVVGSATADGSGNWTITSIPVAPGTHSFTATATNLVGTSTPSPALSVTVQTSLAVTVNEAAGQTDPTSTAPINFTVVFTNPVGNFAAADVSISGTAGGTKTATVTGGPTSYNVAINGMTTAGTVIVSLAAGVATDSAGNANTASTSTDNTVTWAPGAPTVTVNQVTGQPDPTATSPINFTIVFSSPVTGFTGSDVVITGTAGGTKVVTLTGSGASYNAAVSGMTTAGTVIAAVPAGVATSGGTPNLASTSTDNTVTWSPGSPTVTINQATGQADPTSVSPINFTAVFSVAVTGFTGSDVVITGTAGGTKTVTVTGGPTTYNVAVSGMTTAGTVIANIPAGAAVNASAQGNLASTSTDNTVTWAAVATSITLTTSAPTPPGAHNPVILWGQGITLTVQFAMPGGNNKTFQLQGTRDNVTWTTITTLTTNASGRATLFYTPVTNLWYRAVFAGTPDLAAANSNVVRTVVRQLALLRPTNHGAIRTINRNASIQFTTTVRPARPELAPARVTFTFFRFSSGAWRFVTSRDVVIDSAGLARTTFRFTSVGHWYVRTQANPTPYNANSVNSPLERYRVR
jgi:hypothetical protein